MDKLVKQSQALATPKHFLAEYSVPACVEKFSKVKTVEQALACDVPPLSSIAKSFSKDYVYAYIEMWIVSLNEFSTVKNRMNPDQMRETAVYIYQDYYYFKISDINLVFTNAKKGRYGTYYGHLDGTMVMSWFDKYAEERFKIAESKIGNTYEEAKNQKPDTNKEAERATKAIERVAKSKRNK